jgi:hypothetical protein
MTFKKKIGHIGLVSLLSLSLITAGCSTAWISTLDNILAAAAPALINILNIITIAKGQTLNIALVNKINQDATTIKTLANDFASASTTAAPGVCSQLQAAITTYSNDETQVLALGQVADQATQAKVEILSSLVAGTISAVLAVIPNCQQASVVRLATTAPPIPLKSFVESYNKNLTVKTGNAKVDSFTAEHKLASHGWLVHVLTLGMVR